MAVYPVLFAGGPGSPSANDQPIIDLINLIGQSGGPASPDQFPVTYTNIAGGVPGNLSSFDVLVISGSPPFNSRSPWLNLSIPTLNLAYWTWDDPAFPATSDSTSPGAVSSTQDPDILISATLSHEAITASGLTPGAQYNFGSFWMPSPNGQSFDADVDFVGTFYSTTVHPLWVAVDSGVNVGGVVAADRWMGLSIEVDTWTGSPGSFSTEGGAIMASSLRWLVDAISGAPATPTRTVSFNFTELFDVTTSNSPVGLVDLGLGEPELALTVATSRDALDLQLGQSLDFTVSVEHDWARPAQQALFVVGTRPTDGYMRALSGSGQYCSVVELLEPGNEAALFTNDTQRRTDALKWGAEVDDVTLDRSVQEQRTGALYVPVETSQIPFLIPNNNSHPLHPRSGSRVRIWGGYRRGNDGNDEMYPVATVVLHEGLATSLEDSRELTIDTIDITDQLRVDFDAGGSIESGTNVVEAVLDIIGEVLPPDLHPVNARSTPYTTPLIEYEAGDGRRELVDELLINCGLELTSNEWGQLQIGPVPETFVADGVTPRWIYGDGGLKAIAPSKPIANLQPGGVTVGGGKISEDSDPISVTVFDQDPNSLTFYSPAQTGAGAQLIPYSSDLILSVEQAVTAGIAQLRRSRLGAGFVSFQALANPAMRAGDIVEFTSVDIGIETSNWTVESMTIPTGTPNALMEVELRRSWDPTGGVLPQGTGVPQPTVPTVLDDFNRADEDLSVSPNWREFGSSFNVVDMQAEQGWITWCFALWENPLEVTDHRSSVVVTRMLRSDTYVGPMIRSSGQFSGYAALVNGLDLAIYRMKNGSPEQQISDTFNDGFSFDGRTVEIQADGASIVARVNGAQQLTATDSAYPGGTYVGICGKGFNWVANPPGAPRVGNFSAGPAI